MSVRMYMCDCLLGTANFRDKEDDENGHATTAHYELQRTRQSGQNRCELCETLQSPSTAAPISLSHATKDTVMLPHVEPFFVPTSMSAPFAARMTGAWPVISRAIFFLSGGSRHLSPLGVSGRACSVLVSLRSTHGTRQDDAFRQFPDNVFSGCRTNVLRL